MDTRVEALLEDLAKLCSTVALHQDDWKKLYAVSLCAHARGGVPDPRTMKRYLMDHGCSIQKAGFLSRQFDHLCTVLRMYDEQKSPTAGS